MSIEAEIKARVRDVDGVHSRLNGWADPEVAVYSDTYLDRRGELTDADRELRVRRIRVGDDTTTVLTYKGEVVDAESGSKSELETTVDDPDTTVAILEALGYRTFVAFDKHCTNYRFTRHGLSLLATVVSVPQIDGTFIEVESVVAGTDDPGSALEVIRTILGELGIDRAEETRDTYTDAVLAAARTSPDRL